MYAQLIDHYLVLGVARDVTPTELKKTYRALARTLHPDIAGADPRKAERFKAITFAYEVLSDARKRAELDRELKQAERLTATPQAGPYTPTPPSTTAYSYPASESARLDREWRDFTSRPIDWTRRVFRWTSNWEWVLGLVTLGGVIYCLVKHISMDPVVFLFSTSSSKPLQDNLDPIIGVFIGAVSVYIILMLVYIHAICSYYAVRRRMSKSNLIRKQGGMEVESLGSNRNLLTGQIDDTANLLRPAFGALAAELWDMAGWFSILTIVAGAFIGHFCF